MTAQSHFRMHVSKTGHLKFETPDRVSLFTWKQCIGFPRSFLTFRWMGPQTFLSIGLSVLCPAWPLHRVSPKLSGHTLVKSASSVTLHLRDQFRICNAFHGIVEMHLRLDVGRLWYFRIRHNSRPNLSKFLHLFGDRSSVIFFSNFSCTLYNRYGSPE